MKAVETERTPEQIEREFERQYAPLIRERMKERYGRGKIRGEATAWEEMTPKQRERAVIAEVGGWILSTAPSQAAKSTFADAQRMLRAALRAFDEQEIGR